MRDAPLASRNTLRTAWAVLNVPNRITPLAARQFFIYLSSLYLSAVATLSNRGAHRTLVTVLSFFSTLLKRFAKAGEDFCIESFVFPLI
jgi:hypothetical protein